MPRSIPDRWTQYKPVGEKVQGTRFIAFKVPLRRKINETVEECERFDANMLLEAVPDLGLIIDLTNTDRYYDPQCFESKGVEHRKLKIPGHVTPPQHLVRMFKRYVQDYLRDNKHNDKLIGVHCTHGVNRSGFFICNYMISELTIDPDDAIKDFGVARGHSIERKNYLAALKKMGAKHQTQKQNDNLEHDSPPKRRCISSNRERLISFEDRWNTKRQYNHPNLHQRRGDIFDTRNHAAGNRMVNNNRPNYNRFAMHCEGNKIDYNARWNYACPNKNSSNWHDRQCDNEGIQRNWRDRQHNDQDTQGKWHDRQYDNEGIQRNWRDRQHNDQDTQGKWHDRQYDDQDIQRNRKNSSKYTWNKNSRNDTDNQHDTQSHIRGKDFHG